MLLEPVTTRFSQNKWAYHVDYWRQWEQTLLPQRWGQTYLARYSFEMVPFESALLNGAHHNEPGRKAPQGALFKERMRLDRELLRSSVHPRFFAL